MPTKWCDNHSTSKPYDYWVARNRID